MGHSIQVIGKHHKIFKDGDLEILLGIMLDLVKANPSRYGFLLSLAPRWEKTRLHSGPGCIDMELDELASKADARGEILSLLSSVENYVDSLGDFIDADTVNERWGIEGVVWLDDYPSIRLKNAIDELRELVHSSEQDIKSG